MRHVIWMVCILAGGFALGVLACARREHAPAWVQWRLFAVVGVFAAIIAVVAPYGA